MSGIAAKQTLMSQTKIKDVEWDYDTIFSLRNQFAQQLSPVGQMPTLLATYTLTKFVNFNTIILSIRPGWLGFLGRYASSDQILHYWLYDTENNAWEDTEMSLDLGSSTNYSGGMVINKAGKVVFLNRYLGKVWCFNQDGTDLQYLGQTNTSFSTSFSVRLYANYDGTCIAFGEDATNGKRYKIDENFNITQPGTIPNTYPYNYIQLPGKVVVTGSTGIMSIYNENMTSTLVSNRSVSQYHSLTGGLYISPFTENLIMYGMNVLTTNLGINVSSNANFVTTANHYSQGNITGAYLPTGEFIWRHGYHTNYPSQPICNRIYNQSTDTITDIEIFSGTTEPNVSWRALPTGKYYIRYTTSGTTYFKLYDFGFNKKYFPPAMCISPFGYNGGQKNM